MIDSHHHLWAYSDAEYPWIPEDTPCRTDFLLPELLAAEYVDRVALRKDCGAGGIGEFKLKRVFPFQPGLVHEKYVCDRFCARRNDLVADIIRSIIVSSFTYQRRTL